jgi:hypothetical protein
VNLDVVFPAAPSAPMVWLEPGQSRAADPGRWTTFRAPNGATVRLRSGVYYVDVWQFESGSHFQLDQDNGPVVVYVRTRIQWQGTVVVPTGSAPDFLLVYLGTETVYVQAPFRGALVAPSARISFQGTAEQHRGTFFARDVNVEANQSIMLTPVRALLVPLDPKVCTGQIAGRTDLSGDARELAYQQDMQLYCLGRDQDRCQAQIKAAATKDRVQAAAQVAVGRAEPNLYLGVLADRQRKVARSETDSAYATALCSGQDQDNDLVPDSQDTCPGTSLLTPTDDRGCPVALPDGPPGDQVREVLKRQWIALNKTCRTGTVPELMTPGAFFWPSDASKGVFWVTSRVEGQPTGCAVWYEIEILGETRDGQPAHLRVVFPEVRRQTTDLVGMAGRPVPPEFVQFQAVPSDTGRKGQLANDLKPYRAQFRARAINSAGARSPWTNWRSQTPRDCQSLGFRCGG